MILLKCNGTNINCAIIFRYRLRLRDNINHIYNNDVDFISLIMMIPIKNCAIKFMCQQIITIMMSVIFIVVKVQLPLY